ncbi:MAG: hypothetical protein V2I50_00635 [Desulfuromusa sp.]|jgi:hypothetical protein|nr:hypothetical protein [Desulfuromusa sp.]
MSNQLRTIVGAHQRKIGRIKQVKLRKHLNADALFHSLRDSFGKIKDHRSKNAVIPLPDVLMSAFAMFSLKDQSLLSFDKRRKQGGHNLRTGVSTSWGEGAFTKLKT